MELLSANWIVTCDKGFHIYEDYAIVFEEKIIDIDTISNIEKKYPTHHIESQGENSVIMPGLINSHIHLEFSSNKTKLSYGNFVKWLFSVIENKEDIINNSTNNLITNELYNMIKTGTTTIGAISSYGFDMQSCIKSPLNVVYFTEILGSKADMIDTLFLDFKEKLNQALLNQKDNFIPAIAIHSPYSTHPFLIREVLKIANEKDLIISAHYMESKAENDWLNYSKGEFKKFFNELLQQNSSLCNPKEFLELFKNNKNISFTHCVMANEQELKQIEKLNGSIIHCPTSNRLLTNSKLNLQYLDNINLSIGTDGLSSNNSLSIFDELRNALFTHNNIELNILSEILIKASTIGGAKALNLQDKGSLEPQKHSDIIVFNLPDKINNKANLLQNIILHTKQVKKTYIKGKNELS